MYTRVMPQGPGSAEAEPRAIERIDRDLPCARCGYNLRSLAISGRCPECGKPVRWTIDGNWLRYGDPAHLTRLHRAIGLALVGFWLVTGGIASAFILPILLSAVPIIGGQRPPRDAILAFAPSAAITLAGLVLVFRHSLRLRADAPLDAATPDGSRGGFNLRSRLASVMLLSVLLAMAIGGIILVAPAIRGSSTLRVDEIMLHLELYAASIAALGLWLHALVVMHRISRIQRRCKDIPERRVKRLRHHISEVTTVPPLFMVMVWAAWMSGIGGIRDRTEAALAAAPAMLGFTALVWWLTIVLLHRTRRHVAAEIEAMPRDA